MAQRRMLAQAIIDSDYFLEMPASARLLYYDLNMRADDDGFVSNPKKIIKIIGVSGDDLKILFAKQYVMPFETGVCVIRHWLIHNLIRHDRYHETEYKSEKSQLSIIDKKYEKIPKIADESMANICQPDGNPGKVRLGKARLDEASQGEASQGEARGGEWGGDDLGNFDEEGNEIVDNSKKTPVELKIEQRLRQEQLTKENREKMKGMSRS